MNSVRIRLALVFLGLLPLSVALIFFATRVSASDVSDPLEKQQNLERVGHLEIPGAFSIAFSSTEPEAYVSTRGNDGAALVVVDIRTPTTPQKRGMVELPGVGVEDLTLAERDDGTTFALVGGQGGGPGLVLIDVSDAENPKELGRLPRDRHQPAQEPSDDESHTWTCLARDCRYAYGTQGKGGNLEQASVVDLTDPKAPKLVKSFDSLVAGSTITHDWNYDEAGFMWAVGNGGIAAYDVKNPVDPKPLNTSDANGKHGSIPYNDRLHLHGSLRPNARRFKDAESPSVDRGNVLLVSEEGNNHDCTDSFQTWHVPQLDGFGDTTPTPNSGSITPLDDWSLLEHTIPGESRPLALEFCSVHWFDYHQGGFVAMATYEAGTRVLDVRNAHKIEQLGYHFDEEDEAVQSYWVPERDDKGKSTRRATNLIYTADVGSAVTGLGGPAIDGGIDIFRATLPK